MLLKGSDCSALTILSVNCCTCMTLHSYHVGGEVHLLMIRGNALMTSMPSRLCGCRM